MTDAREVLRNRYATHMRTVGRIQERMERARNHMPMDRKLVGELRESLQFAWARAHELRCIARRLGIESDELKGGEPE